MDNNFIMNSSGWDYANLARSAANHGGPQKFVDAVYNAGRASDRASAILLGIAVGATVGVATYAGAIKWLSSRRKSKIEELILQQENNENTNEEISANLQ